MDIAYLGAIVVFLGLTCLLAIGCYKLGEQP